eukprot:3340262-Amphidinium_carterae.1
MSWNSMTKLPGLASTDPASYKDYTSVLRGTRRLCSKPDYAHDFSNGKSMECHFWGRGLRRTINLTTTLR